MKNTMSVSGALKCLSFPAFFFISGHANAYTEDAFFALWQEYQQFCGRMLADPGAFHDNPTTQIGTVGDVDYAFAQDLSAQDYTLTTRSPNPGYERLHQMVSYKAGQFIEQSCVVMDSASSGLGTQNIETLAAKIKAVFVSSTGFDITGGTYVVSGPNERSRGDYLFTVTGAFQGQEIMTLITISEYDIVLEHTNLSKTFP